MIPRLLDANAVDFTQAGIPLTDCIYCKVTEERNGIFELELKVSTTTPYFEQLEIGKLIVAKPNHTQSPQAFEIYEISRPILQRVTVRAHHISYRLSFIPIEPFSCTGITQTMLGLMSHAMEINPFTLGWDSENETSTYNQIAPASFRSRLGGTEGSVLDIFGGEYLWNNFNVTLMTHRGSDNGVQLRLGKNITGLEQNESLERVVTGALPYWHNDDESLQYYGDIQYSSAVSDYAYKRTVVLDLSDQFEDTPTTQMLNEAAQEYLTQINLATPNKNIKVSFIDLADTEEYKNSPLERVNLCDTIQVLFSPLNINYSAKVIALTFDVLAERTLEVEVGDTRSSFTNTVVDLVGDISSLTTGKKLVSVTQTINRDIGEITNTVGSIQEQTNQIDESVSKLQIDTEGITSSVSTIQTTLTNDVYTKLETNSKIEQSATNVTTKFETAISDASGEVLDTVSTMIRMSGDGIDIGITEGDTKTIIGHFDNDSLDFIDTQTDTTLAWVSANDGLGGDSLSIGDATTAENRWRIFTRENGSHLTFTRHN